MGNNVFAGGGIGLAGGAANSTARPIRSYSFVSVTSMVASVPAAAEPEDSVFLPGRNILLIGLAAVWCSTHDVSYIAIGSLGGNPFPDATDAFFANYENALNLGLEGKLCLVRPYAHLTKTEVIQRGRFPLRERGSTRLPSSVNAVLSVTRGRRLRIHQAKASLRRRACSHAPDVQLQST